MKKYIVNVNGTSYEVAIEQVSEASVASAQTDAPVAAPAPVQAAATAPAPAPAPAPAAAANGEKIESPMPGSILKVNVANGQAVKQGDVLMILEAMKMENEIMAPVDGTIASLSVSQGSTVDSGSLLCVIQ